MSTINASEVPFHSNSMLPKGFRNIPNLRQNFYKRVWPPPFLYKLYKKHSVLIQDSVPYTLTVVSPPHNLKIGSKWSLIGMIINNTSSLSNINSSSSMRPTRQSEQPKRKAQRLPRTPLPAPIAYVLNSPYNYLAAGDIALGSSAAGGGDGASSLARGIWALALVSEPSTLASAAAPGSEFPPPLTPPPHATPPQRISYSSNWNTTGSIIGVMMNKTSSLCNVNSSI